MTQTNVELHHNITHMTCQFILFLFILTVLNIVIMCKVIWNAIRHSILKNGNISNDSKWPTSGIVSRSFRELKSWAIIIPNLSGCLRDCISAEIPIRTTCCTSTFLLLSLCRPRFILPANVVEKLKTGQKLKNKNGMLLKIAPVTYT